MPRKKLLRTASIPYHVTARSHNKDFFPLPLDLMWNLFSTYLHFCSGAFEIRIHAFVMMSNHFHMLVSTPQANLDLFMNYFMRESAKAINRDTGMMNQVYGGPYFRSIIPGYGNYTQVYRYVYRNPVEAGLAKNAEHYPYSTLAGILGSTKLVIPTFDNVGLTQEPDLILRWLNQQQDTETSECIRDGLRKAEFTPARLRSNRKIPIFEPPRPEPFVHH